MEERIPLQSRGGALFMSCEAAEALISSADGKAALLYIHILRNGGNFDREAAGKALSMSAQEVEKAACALISLRLLNNKLTYLKPDTPPEYTAEDIKARLKERPDFAGLVQETQRRLGKLLSGSELTVLFGIYDYLGMPTEVMLLLITHCMEEYCRRYGEGRTPTVRYIEKEAYAWARLDILTQERAEEHLRRRTEGRRKTEEIKKVLRIKKRELSPTEEKYIEAWLEMGFDAEALELAYDKTVVKTGGMSWAYMNSIVKSWHSKGLHKLSEISEGDCAKNTKKPAKTAESAPTREEYERMKRYLEKMRQD